MNKGAAQQGRFIPRRHWRVRWSRLKLYWPVLVWFAACVAAFWLYHSNPATFSETGIKGVVDAETVSLAPVEVARIRTIHATAGQAVKHGDVLVEMDTSLIARDVTADLLDAITIDTAFGDTHQDILQAVSQRLDAIAAIESDLALCQQEFEREKAELTALETEQARRQELHRDHLVDEITSNELQPSVQALRKAVSFYPERLATFRRQLEAARTSYRHIADWLAYREGDSISQAVSRHLDEERVGAIIERVKSEASLRAEAYRLRAPRDGVVADILRHEGDVVGPEFPIIRMVTAVPARINAYIEESRLLDLHIGEQVDVVSMYRRNAAPIKATVRSVSTDIGATAYVLSGTGRPLPLRARRAVLTIDGTHDLLAGENVYLHPRADTWRGWFDRVPVLLRSLVASGERGPP